MVHYRFPREPSSKLCLLCFSRWNLYLVEKWVETFIGWFTDLDYGNQVLKNHLIFNDKIELSFRFSAKFKTICNYPMQMQVLCRFGIFSVLVGHQVHLILSSDSPHSLDLGDFCVSGY